MGLYGSPDLGNLYTEKKEPNEPNKPKSKKNKVIWIIMAVLNVLVLSVSENNKSEILVLIFLNCIAIFIGSIVNMIYNLLKKNSIKNNLICIALSIIISLIIMFNIESTENINNHNSDQNIMHPPNVTSQQTGSRLNPAKKGEVQQSNAINVVGLDCLLEIELLEVRKKDDATEMGKNIYTYVKLEENQEYLFAKFRVKNIKNNSKQDLPFEFNWTNFSYATGDYKKYNYSMGLAAGGELLEAVDLYEGAEHTGWICLYVEKDDQNPKAVFLDNIWFDL